MPKAQRHNPVQTALRTWLANLPPPPGEGVEAWKDSLFSSAPKRFTLYEPMALLPSGSFKSVIWTTTLESCGAEALTLLWTLLLRELSNVAKGPLTSLAINEGIPLSKEGPKGMEENVLRSPTGLRMLHGYFGPASTREGIPTAEELSQALWVSTKQSGLYQTWAPRWTMFSRGNVKEKARVLAFGKPPSREKQSWAVDLYAGIGYFVFSYAALGMRVLCWEINPWSVEGLRRGAIANGWSVRVVASAEDLAQSAEDLVAGGEQIVVFFEDNQQAQARLARLQQAGIAQDVRHVNGGLLPTSEPTWEAAWAITQTDGAAEEAWLHLHENVALADIEGRRKVVEERFRKWNEADGEARDVSVAHVERVKTFAPGVWHCVFDVLITEPKK